MPGTIPYRDFSICRFSPALLASASFREGRRSVVGETTAFRVRLQSYLTGHVLLSAALKKGNAGARSNIGGCSAQVVIGGDQSEYRTDRSSRSEDSTLTNHIGKSKKILRPPASRNNLLPRDKTHLSTRALSQRGDEGQITGTRPFRAEPVLDGPRSAQDLPFRGYPVSA